MRVVRKISPLLESSKLRHAPVVIRVVDFTEAAAKEFAVDMARAHETGQPVIPIIIDSYGGQVYSLMAMISEIRHAELPIATIIEGKAMSCGAILSTFGTKGMRYMDPDATLMIHDVSSFAWGKVEEFKASAAEVERLNQKVYRMMAANCGKPSDYFLKLVYEKKHADWYLDAKEAVKHGIVNHVRVPKLEVETTVTFALR